MSGKSLERWYPGVDFDQIGRRDYFLYSLAGVFSLVGIVLMGGRILGRATGMTEETIF
jgi:hypothetical protein